MQSHGRRLPPTDTSEIGQAREDGSNMGHFNSRTLMDHVYFFLAFLQHLNNPQHLSTEKSPRFSRGGFVRRPRGSHLAPVLPGGTGCRAGAAHAARARSECPGGLLCWGLPGGQLSGQVNKVTNLLAVRTEGRKKSKKKGHVGLLGRLHGRRGVVQFDA